MEPATFDEELLCWLGGPSDGLSAEDASRIRGIAEEFAAGFRALGRIDRAVTIFGSARTSSTEPEYALAREVAACLGSAGYAILTGGGPGIMVARGRVRDEDLALLHLTDRPEKVCAIIDAACARQHAHYQSTGG